MSEGTLLLVVTVDVDPAVEAEFNDWYDNVHLPEVVACPGFIRGRRARAESDDQSPRYITYYEVEGRHVVGTPELKAVGGWARFADHVSNARQLWFRNVGPGVAHE